MKSGLMEKRSRFRHDMLLESHDALYDDRWENINLLWDTCQVFDGAEELD